MAEGISQIGKAFVVATMIVFGGATITFAFPASQLDLQSVSTTYYYCSSCQL
ncbi:hypothetical protein EJ110_NYTH54942 [Nymphaea thermarum]|nr:hypothetical protein EJ110_NYTH54942 [Nymphaea thermarum]